VRRALVFAALLGTPFVARAQDSAVVYGTVRDTAGRPIAATVTVVNGTAATQANRYGRYRLVVPAGYAFIRAQFVGYLSVETAVHAFPGDSVSHDFALTLSIVQVDDFIVRELRPVITTAAKRSQLLDLAVTSVALVTDPKSRGAPSTRSTKPWAKRPPCNS